MRGLLTLAGLTLVLLAGCWALAWSDGTETLGPPADLAVQSGTGVVAAGTGLFAQPATIEVRVPEQARVRQVLLYWEGQSLVDQPGDDTIVVEGREVRGRRIGGPTRFFGVAAGDVLSSAYRADITSLELVGPGANRLGVEGAAFGFRNDGAGVLVVYDDGGPAADLQLRDGDDLAYVEFAPPLDTTVAQRFAFPPAAAERNATVTLMVGSVGHARPNAVEIDVDGASSRRVDALASTQGNEWDVLTTPIAIPAGATALSVRVLSADDGSGRQPASLAWVQTTLAISGASSVGQSPSAQPLRVQVVDTNDADRDGVFSDDETAPSEAALVPFQVVLRNPNRVPVVVDTLVDAFPRTLVDLLTATLHGGGATLSDDTCGSLAGAVIAAESSILADGRPATCTFAIPGYAPAPGASVQDTVLVRVHELGRPESSAIAADSSTVRTRTSAPAPPATSAPAPPATAAPPRSTADLPAPPASPPARPAAIDVVKIAATPRDASGSRTVVLPGAEGRTEVTYLYVVSNVGDLPLSRVTLVDDVLGPITLGRSELAPGQSTIGEGSHVVTPTEAQRGVILNRAVARGTAPDGASVQSEAVERIVLRGPTGPASVAGVVPPQPAPAPPGPAQVAPAQPGSPQPAPAEPVVVPPAAVIVAPAPAAVLGANTARVAAGGDETAGATVAGEALSRPAGSAVPPQLPRTGAHVVVTAAVALAALIWGAGLLLAERRRRRAGTAR